MWVRTVWLAVSSLMRVFTRALWMIYFANQSAVTQLCMVYHLDSVYSECNNLRRMIVAKQLIWWAVMKMEGRCQLWPIRAISKWMWAKFKWGVPWQPPTGHLPLAPVTLISQWRIKNTKELTLYLNIGVSKNQEAKASHEGKTTWQWLECACATRSPADNWKSPS